MSSTTYTSTTEKGTTTCGPILSYGKPRRVALCASVKGEPRLCVYRKVGESEEVLWAELPISATSPFATVLDYTEKGEEVTYRAEVRCPASITIQAEEKY